jgi:hypothetical protein
MGMLAIIGGLVLGCMRMNTRLSSDSPAPGKPAPEITGSDANGESFRLSDYRGKVVLLDFWATH